MTAGSAHVAERIVSFLPSASEMVCALGLGDRLVGITHECDYPPELRGKPIVVRSALSLEGLKPEEVDAEVRARLRSGASLYSADERILQELAPDLIVTQDLCQVCAPSGNEVSLVLKALPQRPEVLYMTPKSLEEIFENLRELGQATGRPREAERIISESRSRLTRIRAITRTLPNRPRVFCMEWMDPVYCSGHWVPEMLEFAGGADSLSRRGADSVRVSWSDVVEWDPEVLIISPCGYHLPQAIEDLPRLFEYPRWGRLSAVRGGRVYAVDASSYLARPGPRVVDGVELLAHLIHPELFPWIGPSDAYCHVEWSIPQKASTS